MDRRSHSPQRKGAKSGIAIRLRQEYGGNPELLRLRTDSESFKSIVANPKTSV